MSGAVAAVLAARWRRGGKRFVHDAADGARATSTLGAATEAMINLAGGARRIFAGRESATHVLVREYVARANNHGWQSPAAIGSICNYPYRCQSNFANEINSL
jgi:hypothetical protein